MSTKTSITSGMKGNLLVLFAGLIFPLGLAPLNIWPLIPISLALFVLLLEQQSAGRSFSRAFFFGLGMNGVGVSWVYVSIHFHGDTPAWLAVVGTAGFVAFLSLLYALPFWLYGRLHWYRYPILTFPALWVLLEWSKSWLLSGFPWLWAGYGLLDSPAWGLAPVSGSLGLSLLAALSGVLLVWIFKSDSTQRGASAVALTALWGACWGLGQLEWTQPELKKTRKVALIQGNIPQEQKWDPLFRDKIINTYTTLTEQSWDADLILWPEAAYPVFYHQALGTIADLDIRASEKNTSVISGVARWEPLENGDEHYYNSIFVIGEGEGVYNKQKLVPFGEYVPLASLIRGLIPFFNLPMSDFNEGAPDQSPLRANNLSFAAYICYEIVYPELVRTQAKDRDFLITISNDAWFGHSWGPLQHFQMARMRALETGKYILRGTNTGITAIIDHKGHVQSQLPQFEKGVLKGIVYGTTGETPFVSYGHWPLLGICAFIFLLGAVLCQRSQPQEADVRPLYHN